MSEQSLLLNSVRPPKPSEDQVKKYLNIWNSEEMEKYVAQEKSINKLFDETYPSNVDIDDVLIKVCALNSFYSTNIFNPFAVAKKILEENINFDFRVKKGNCDLVSDIAIVKVDEGKFRNFYSFATKYCSHHNPDFYPIYDSFVEKILLHFKKVDKFAQFKKEDLKDYPKFKTVLQKFQSFYNLDKFSLKQIDRYLWLAGKEYFPKNYGKAKK